MFNFEMLFDTRKSTISNNGVYSVPSIIKTIYFNFKDFLNNFLTNNFEYIEQWNMWVAVDVLFMYGLWGDIALSNLFIYGFNQHMLI